MLMRLDNEVNRLRDFGDELDSNYDGSIIQTAARSFMSKTSGLLTPEKLTRRLTSASIDKAINEYSGHESQITILSSEDIRDLYERILGEETILEVAGEHLTVIYSLPYLVNLTDMNTLRK